MSSRAILLMMMAGAMKAAHATTQQPDVSADDDGSSDALCAASPSAGWVVKDYWPVKSCKPECRPLVLNRGWGVWPTKDGCCAPGAGFTEGCSPKPPTTCWVVESYSMRTCIQDDRKCLQGYGVWPSEEVCCAPNVAFPTGCGDVPKSAQPCWVVDTFYPSRLCRSSNTLCTAEAGMFYPTKEACCGPTGAFGKDNCSATVPQAPCWLVDSYWPIRACRREESIAACNRGWGVYSAESICCAPNVAFPEGCSNVTSDFSAPLSANMSDPAMGDGGVMSPTGRLISAMSNDTLSNVTTDSLFNATGFVNSTLFNSSSLSNSTLMNSTGLPVMLNGL